MIWTANAACESMGFVYGAETVVSYLPLSHVAAQVMDIFIPLLQAVTVYFAQPDALKVRLAISKMSQ
jgi:long-chain-fatty-acid--CoA ligase ACSBG